MGRYIRQPRDTTDYQWEEFLTEEQESRAPSVSHSDVLRRFVDDLPDDQRHVIERVFFGRASMREAGREIGLDEGKVRVVRDRAIKALRERLVAVAERASGGADSEQRCGEEATAEGPLSAWLDLLRGEGDERSDGED